MIKQRILGLLWLCALGLGLTQSVSCAAQQTSPDRLTYADFADLALPSKMVAKVQIKDVVEVPASATNLVEQNHVRRYVTASVVALIKGREDSPSSLNFIVDSPLDARGRAPKIKNSLQLIFSQYVPGQPNAVQLVAPDAMVSWNASRESLLVSILSAAAAADSPPRVTGIDSGFTVAGTVAGERETQIFLTTDSRPVSLSIVHRPNEVPHWSVALGEIVDKGAPPPIRDTLLWYQLACHLPMDYPEAKLAGLPDDQVAALRADYGLVKAGLGDCPRGR